MGDVCVFIEYNGQWDGTQSYVGGEMNGILMPESTTYVGLIELVRSAIGIRGPAKTIVMRYGVEPGLPFLRIQCDADVKFYIQLKKKDVHVLSKFPITIDVLDESAAEAMPPELEESNHIDVQLPTEAVQSDEAIQHVDDRNLIIPPLPPHVDELKFAGDARQSNQNSIAASIGAHSIANYTTSQSVNVPSSDSVSGSLVVADYTPVTIRINSIFENKKLLQYHLHHDAMSKHYQYKVKRSNSTLLHVIFIDIKKYQWQLRATRMKGSELFVVKRYDDVHTCSIEIVQGHHRQVKSLMIGEWVKAKYLDPTNTSYRPREIMRDMQAEFGVSFNYLRAWRGEEAALTSLRGDDPESYNAASKHSWPYCHLVIVVDGSTLKAKFGGMLLAACGHDANSCIFPLAFDAAYGICVQHLAANLKTKYKDFKGPLKTYFDGAARSYLVSRSYKVVASIFQRAEVCNHDNQHCGVIEQCGSESQVNASWILSGMVEGTTTKMICHESILLAAQMARMFLKKSGHKLSILPKQSVGPEGHGLEGFCLKEKNMSLFGVVDVLVMDTTDKPVPISYP
ncbi:hypothetical protein TIFTF001_052516 [Ficus carica]|uniref:Uncharacterized protein n=1 Tax=Ficus carica TaxID=3494 RepID=A0AA88EJP3_FICCA|nr:hypothetical protein TIFTF001_052515 [Ficus carica]GMN75041.1 hypothetical protein TIFTF001_052516 [Ficus carica]